MLKSSWVWILISTNRWTFNLSWKQPESSGISLYEALFSSVLNEISFICTAQHHDHIASVNDILRTSRRDDWLTQHVGKRKDVRNLRTTVCWQRGSCAISSLIAEVILTKPALLHVCGSRVSQLDSLTFIKWSSELKHLQEEQESTNTNILLGKYIPTPWTHVERDNEQNSSLPADEQLTDIMWSCGQLSVWTLVCLPPTHESLWNRLFCIMNQNQNQSREVNLQLGLRTQSRVSVKVIVGDLNTAGGDCRLLMH